MSHSIISLSIGFSSGNFFDKALYISLDRLLKHPSRRQYWGYELTLRKRRRRQIKADLEDYIENKMKEELQHGRVSQKRLESKVSRTVEVKAKMMILEEEDLVIEHLERYQWILKSQGDELRSAASLMRQEIEYAV